MNCATVFCLRRIDVRIPTIPVSFITLANGRYTQLPSFLRRGCLPMIYIAVTQAVLLFGSVPSLLSTLYNHPQLRLTFLRFLTTSG